MTTIPCVVTSKGDQTSSHQNGYSVSKLWPFKNQAQRLLYSGTSLN